MTGMLAPAAIDDVNSSDAAPGPPAIRVVIIDPRPERRAITNLLVDRSPRLTVVGLASDLSEARATIRTDRADLALLEIQMPVTDGLTVITALRGEFPMLRIVVSSFHADQSTRDGARASGADGYLRKPLQLDELVTLADRPAQGPSDGPETS